MKVSTCGYLHGLGADEGAPVIFHWTLPSIVPPALPWLALLGLLALPSNRHWRAWWVWAPAFGMAALAALAAALRNHNEPAAAIAQMAAAGSFAVAAVWLVGRAPGDRPRRWLDLLLQSSTFVAVALLAFFVTPLWQELWEVRQWVPGLLGYTVLFWTVCGLVLAGSLHLTAITCRRFGWLRLCVILALWLLTLWSAAAGLLAAALALAGEYFEWLDLARVLGTVFAASCAVLAPYLMLSAANRFYGKRMINQTGGPGSIHG